ncbi:MULTISPECIES: contact-dependent growth inhibition system immunity protein [Streptomycetaceae]|nr:MULTISPECIES: contact-dependent growth inhibition system immunity protein [Streptomycetaceae]
MESFDSDERWFQELPRLLNSYTVARGSADCGNTPADVDSGDRPSLAMRGYLRAATRHPGRVPRVISEIEKLLSCGPTEEILLQLADSGITPDRLQASDGASLDVYLGRMLPHLRAFVAGGERIEPSVPETWWEWEQRFPELKSLLGGNFYMYWQDDHADHEAVISEYLKYVDAETARAVVADIEGVRSVARTEKQLEGAFQNLGFHGYPPKGMTWSQWLARIEERMTGYLDAR